MNNKKEQMEAALKKAQSEGLIIKGGYPTVRNGWVKRWEIGPAAPQGVDSVTVECDGKTWRLTPIEAEFCEGHLWKTSRVRCVPIDVTVVP